MEQKFEEMSEEYKLQSFLDLNLKKFLNTLIPYKGSRDQIKRAWTNAAITPFNKDQFQFSYPGEQELFDQFTELTNVKFLMMVYALQREGKIEIKESLVKFESVNNSVNETQINESIVEDTKKEE